MLRVRIVSIASFWIAAELVLREETLMCHFLQEKVRFSDPLPVHFLLATPMSDVTLCGARIPAKHGFRN